VAEAGRTAHHDAIGVLVLNEKGEIKVEKVGKRSMGKGAGIGLILALFTPIGLAVRLIGGGLLGALHHKGLGLDEADRERIGRGQRLSVCWLPFPKPTSWLASSPSWAGPQRLMTSPTRLSRKPTRPPRQTGPSLGRPMAAASAKHPIRLAIFPQLREVRGQSRSTVSVSVSFTRVRRRARWVAGFAFPWLCTVASLAGRGATDLERVLAATVARSRELSSCGLT
jgi:hypothetical protein